MAFEGTVAVPDKRLSEMEDSELVQRQLAVFKDDYDFREIHTSFEKSRWLYERRTSASNGGVANGIPTRNLIRRAVDDRHALSITNIPKTKMIANMDIDQRKTFTERYVQVLSSRQAEETLNAHVQNLLRENRFVDERAHALKQSAIYGVGYIKVDIDQTADTRYSAKLRELMRKDLWEWTEQDAESYNFLINRVDVRHVNAPDVYWQHGIRKVDDTMMRVSIVERSDVNTLRRLYDNPEIRVGKFPWEINEDPSNEGNIAAIITTWELEPVIVEKTLEVDGKTEMSIEANEWIMVKTVIAGGQLVEKTITANFEDEESKIEHGSIRLPIVPYYLQKSEEHPYGFSIPEQMEISEEFINRMYLIMYKTARKAASNQGMIINASLLGDGDLYKIQKMLDEGGVAPIRGNESQQHNPDLSKVVVPLNPYNAQLPISVVEAVRNEENAFQQQSGSVNLAAISRARSGSGKRAEVTATDRPKTASIGNVSTSEELVHEAVYNLVQIYQRQHINVPVEMPGQGRQMVPLNMEMSRVLPVLDDQGDPVFNDAFADPELAGPLFNPAGIAMQEVHFVINSVSLHMIAVSDGRSELPHDIVQKLQLISALHQIAPLEPETLHEMILPKEIRITNEAFKSKRMEMERQLLALQGGLLPQGGQGQVGATPSFPQLTEVDGLSNLVQDVQADQDQGNRELNRDQARFGLPQSG